MGRKDPDLKVVGDEPLAAAPQVDDAADIEALLEPPDPVDSLTTSRMGSIPLGRPKGFIRIVPDLKYRRKGKIYVLKREDMIDEPVFLLTPKMAALMEEEAKPALLITYVDRLGTPGIWPIREPAPGQADFLAWSSARAVAKQGLTRWVKAVWKSPSIGFVARVAPEGYAPMPDISKLAPYPKLLVLAFGANIIRSPDHATYRDEFLGESNPNDNDGVADLDEDDLA